MRRGPLCGTQESDIQVAAPTETRNAQLAPSKYAQQRVRMEGWRQIGANLLRNENYKAGDKQDDDQLNCLGKVNLLLTPTGGAGTNLAVTRTRRSSSVYLP